MALSKYVVKNNYKYSQSSDSIRKTKILGIVFTRASEQPQWGKDKRKIVEKIVPFISAGEAYR